MNTALKTGLLGAVMSLTAPIAAFAQESSNPLPGTVTGNIAIVTDYVFRGITQASNQAAVQGGLDWDTGTGFHFGTWASSLNFADTNDATTEIDLYGGYGGKIDNFSYDLGFTFYWYPGAPGARNYNLWEVYGKAGYDFGAAAVTTGVAYTPDNFGATGDATYLNTVVTIPIVDNLSISAGAGYWMLTQGFKEQTDWNIGATMKVFDWFDVDARYYDSDVSFLGNLADDRYVLKISRAF